MASEDDMFLFGRDGCSHFGPDLYATLRVSGKNTLLSQSEVVVQFVGQSVSQSVCHWRVDQWPWVSQWVGA